MALPPTTAQPPPPQPLRRNRRPTAAPLLATSLADDLLAVPPWAAGLVIYNHEAQAGGLGGWVVGWLGAHPTLCCNTQRDPQRFLPLGGVRDHTLYTLGSSPHDAAQRVGALVGLNRAAGGLPSPPVFPRPSPLPSPAVPCLRPHLTACGAVGTARAHMLHHCCVVLAPAANPTPAICQ